MPAVSPNTNRVTLAAPGEAVRQLFPLPVVPFELLMLLDDTAEFPMTFAIEMVFRGRPDRDWLARAIAAAVERHPLLRAKIDWTGRNPVWVLEEPAQTPITWLADDQRHEGDRLRPIDLRRQCGLRVLAAEGTPRSSVWMHFHHACCDGQGARRFAADVLAAYAHAAGQLDHPPWETLDYASLSRRHDFSGETAGGGQAATTLWQKIRDAFHFHVLTPRPLSAVLTRDQQFGSKLVRSDRIRKRSFDPSETARLRQKALAGNVNLNDVALALLFATLADWNRQYGRAADSQRLRVLMPTDLRSARDRQMPAANRMSFAFLARSVGQCHEQESLLTGIRDESRYCRQVRIGHDFLNGIALVATIPRLLPLLLRLPRCMATAILTNLGDPTRRFRRRFPQRGFSSLIGNLELEQIFGTPPLRPRMHAGFGLCVCAHQLHLSMIANENVLGDRADELLDSYVQRWQAWLSSSELSYAE